MDKQQRLELEQRLASSNGNLFQSQVHAVLRAVYKEVWVPGEYQADGGCDAYSVGSTILRCH